MGLGAAAAVSAQVLLAPGGAPGIMTATLAGGPVGWVAFLSSPATPDDLGNFTAQVDSAVTVGNTYGPAAMTFWYKLTNVDQTPNGAPLVSLGVPMPSAVPVIVDQQNAGRLSGLGINTGASISFFWTANPVLETQFSGWQAIETPFTRYVEGKVGAIDGTSEDVLALVPIPEPTTYVGLFALGLAGFAAFRRFRA